MDVPRDPKLYKLSYDPLTYQSIPAVIRSHHLEYLHRSMNSRTKQVAMNKLEDNLCRHCGMRATTDHVLNECILATLYKQVFIEFFNSQEWSQPLLREDLFHSYFWWPANIWNKDQHCQIFTFWGILRQHAQEVDHLLRVSRFRSTQFAAKAATGFQRAALVAKLQHKALASEKCNFAQIKAEHFELWCDEILADRIRARRQ